MADRLLQADKAGETLFACIAPETRTTSPEVAERRLRAILHPFQTETDARAALIAAGGVGVREWRR